MNCTLLTKEEIIRGERIFRQLERVKEDNPKTEWFDFIWMFLFIEWSVINDWKNSNVTGKLGIIIAYSPIVYILLSAFHIINC